MEKLEAKKPKYGKAGTSFDLNYLTNEFRKGPKHPETYTEIRDFCTNFKMATEGTVIFTLNQNPGTPKSSTISHIVDFNERCLRNEFPEIHHKKVLTIKKSSSEQLTEYDQVSTEGEPEPGKVEQITPFHGNQGNMFTCRGNDLSPFMPLETLRNEIYKEIKGSEFCYEIYRLKIEPFQGEAMWMFMQMIWPLGFKDKPKVENKTFEHKLLSFNKYVWDTHRQSTSFHVKHISGLNVLDTSHMRVIDDKYYDSPESRPEEMKKFFLRNGIYQKKYKQLIWGKVQDELSDKLKNLFILKK